MKRGEEYIIDDFSRGGVCENFRIVDNKLKLRDGTRKIAEFSEPIRGIYNYSAGDAETIYLVVGNRLKAVGDRGGSFSVSDLGLLSGMSFSSDNDGVEMFMFTGILYLIGGGNYLRYDGSSIETVAGYAPTIRRYANYTNKGSPYESENLLTRQVKMRFVPDGIHYKFALYGDVKSIERVVAYDKEVTDYTATLGTSASVEFKALYSSSSRDVIEVTYTLNTPSLRERVTSCRHAVVYGGDTDSRVFVYAGDTQSVFYPSELIDPMNERKISAEYFPVDGGVTIGDGNRRITGAVRQFDRLALFTDEEAFYTYPHRDGEINDLEHYSFPVLPLNSTVGASSTGGALLVENEPYALNETGLYRFKSTAVRDERLAVKVESPERIGLDREFIEGARLYANKMLGELWCINGGLIIIYNARHGYWYRYTGIAPERLCDFRDRTAFVSARRLYITDGALNADSLPNGSGEISAPIRASYESEWLELEKKLAEKTVFGFTLELDGDVGTRIEAKLSDSGGDEVVRDFTVVSASDAPSVFERRVRLARTNHVKLALTTLGATAGLMLRRAKFTFM